MFQIEGERVAAERHSWKTVDTLVQPGLVETRQRTSA